ncbi:MAG: cytochrome c-type biogenesis protein CcmH [Gammaproteobacteria bacterium]|nr:cytochrome c-type biogenesis protein CcmH [Gammaproteobacteria bacterium]
MRKAFCLIAFFLLCFAALAQPGGMAPEHEKRYYSLLDELRCLVCQNQTIAESDAELAKDLRVEVRKMLQAGATDSEITEFMVSRYGDFVLYRPPVKPRTWLLWFGPLIFLVIALMVLSRLLGKQKRAGSTALTEDEQAKVDSILSRTEE